MVKIIEDNRDAFRQMFSQVDKLAGDRINQTARWMARELFQQVMQRQPVYRGNDPIRPGVRPSERQGYVPIEKGWLGGPKLEYPKPGRIDIVLKSESEHVKYFTNMMGRRQYLGTRHQKGVWAGKNHDMLVFWGDGHVNRRSWVNHQGFIVESDFVEDAWNMILPRAMQRLGNDVKVSLVQSFEGVS